MAFKAKNKFSFIDGSIHTPAEYDLLFNAWKRCNFVIKSWILKTVSKEIAYSLMYIRSVHNIWKELKDRYSQSNCPRIHQLKQQIAIFHRGNLDVTNYYTKQKILWDELGEYRPKLNSQSPFMQSWSVYLE